MYKYDIEKEKEDKPVIVSKEGVVLNHSPNYPQIIRVKVTDQLNDLNTDSVIIEY